MLEKKNNKISATGIFQCSIMTINGETIEWLDAKDFSLANLAATIGIDVDHRVKATITIEIVEQPCELCGNLASGRQLCDECGKLMCDNCAKIDPTGRYCPICFDLRKKPSET
jgi:formylmethanofuran dehydrogenase subunit E